MAGNNLFPFQAAQTRIRREPGYGVAGSGAWKRLNAMGITPGTTFEIDSFAPPGSLVPTINLLNDEFATGSVEGRLDYNSLAFVFAGLFGNPNIVDLGGGAYEWTWSWDGRRPNRPVSFETMYGFPGVAEADHIAGLIFNSFGLSGGRADGFDVSGDVFGKRPDVGQALGGITAEVQTVTITGGPTGGDFTLTLNGEETDPIAFDAGAADVLAALEDLPSVQPGDVVATGGALPTAGVALAFSGYYFAGQNVTAMTADDSGLIGGTSPTVVVTQTTPGSDDIEDVPAVPAGAVQGSIFLDNAWANLGLTRLGYAFDMDYSIGERMTRVRPMNATLTTDDVIDASDQEHTLAITFAINAVERAQFAKIRTGQRSFARVEWVGDEIASSGEDYTLQLDNTLLWSDVGEPGDTDGTMTRQWTGRVSADPVSNKAMAIRLVNALPNLA